MADIDIVPKRKSHVWMWVLLAVVVAAILWALFAQNDVPASGWSMPDAAPMAQMHPGDVLGSRVHT